VALVRLLLPLPLLLQGLGSMVADKKQPKGGVAPG
jgi:hypothetical protein